MRRLLYVFGCLVGAAAVGAGIYWGRPSGPAGVLLWIASGVVYVAIFHILFGRLWPKRPRFRYKPDTQAARAAKYVNGVWAGGRGKSEARNAKGLKDQLRALFAEGTKLVVLVHSRAMSYRLVVAYNESPKGICLCYFPGRKSGHPGFKSIGEMTDEDASLPLGRVSTDNGQSMQIVGKNILDEDLGYEGIAEFFEEPNLPESIPWEVAS